VGFEAILFDNDGVLVDTEELYRAANQELLAEIGITLSAEDYVELFLRTGRGAWPLLEARGYDGPAIQAWRARRNSRYEELVAREDVLIAGAGEIVAALARRYRLAIVTSSEPRPFAQTHARTGLLVHVELVLTRDQYQNGKPDPEPYQRAVERMGLAAEQCLVIEDSERGLCAAKAAGLTCWVVPSRLTRGGCFDAADAVLPDLASVAARLLAPPSPVAGCVEPSEPQASRDDLRSTKVSGA
jgi:HAD superfamily hydrolase (TIGR01509 family)